jgi:pyruvate oxidase
MSLACKTAIIERDVAHLVFPDEVQVLEVGDTEPGSPRGRIGRRDVSPATDVLAKPAR